MPLALRPRQILRTAALVWLAALPLCAEFRAAAVKVDITPDTPKWMMGYGPRQSTGVHDHIFHRIVMMDDGRSRFVLISSDLCLFSPTVYNDLAALVHQRFGIPESNVWWAVTHTHAAPEVGPPGMYAVLLKGRTDHAEDKQYTEQVVGSLMDGIAQAQSKLAPARIAIGTGAAFANINRRARDVDNSISLGMNPEGPVDRQIGLIRLERPDGTPIALIANYAMHGTVLGDHYTEISGDAPGTVATYVEQQIGAPMLYINGAAGNIAPIYTVTASPAAGHLTQFNVLLGDRILTANRLLSAGTADVTLWAAQKTLETPRKQGVVWTDEMSAYARVDSSGRLLVRLPLRFLKVGDTVIWSAPVELFCEIAINVRNASPFTNTFFFGYTDGWLGYLPTKTAFAEGGYEPATSPFSEQAEADLTEAVITYLQGMKR